MQMITTPTGIDLIGQALIDETRGIKFTKVVFGNGADAGDDPTALSNQLVVVGIVDDPTYSNGFATVQIDYSNAGLENGFYLTETGLLAEDPDTQQDVLFAYGHTDTPTWIPAAADYAMEIVETLLIYVGAVENVTAVISESMTYATKAELQEHIDDNDNPHGVTKAQVGLGSVPNVSTNDQTPTYSEPAALSALTSGEKLSIAFGKIAAAVKNLISHLADTNLHLTGSDRQKLNGQHNHAANQITSGELGIDRGGTGAGTAKKARENLGVVSKSGDTMTGTLTVEFGTENSPAKYQAKNTYTGRTAILQADSNGVSQIWNWEDDDNAQWLSVFPETYDLDSSVGFTRRIDGTSTFYKLFGQHNLSLLAATLHTIKSIQQDVTEMSAGQWAQELSLASGTDLSKCVWMITGAYTAAETPEVVKDFMDIRIGHLHDNRLEIIRNDTTNAVNVSWKVIEFY